MSTCTLRPTAADGDPRGQPFHHQAAGRRTRRAVARDLVIAPGGRWPPTGSSRTDTTASEGQAGRQRRSSWTCTTSEVAGSPPTAAPGPADSGPNESSGHRFVVTQPAPPGQPEPHRSRQRYVVVGWSQHTDAVPQRDQGSARSSYVELHPPGTWNEYGHTMPTRTLAPLTEARRHSSPVRRRGLVRRAGQGVRIHRHRHVRRLGTGPLGAALPGSGVVEPEVAACASPPGAGRCLRPTGRRLSASARTAIRN